MQTLVEVVSVENGGGDARSVLHARFVRRHRQQCAWDAEEARDLRAAQRIRLWEHAGCASLVDYLERQCGMNPRVAFDRIRVSDALGSLPLLEAELEAGELAYSAVREIVRVAVPETEQAWVDHARGKTVGQVTRAVSGLRPGDLPGEEPDPDLVLRSFGWKLRRSTIARVTRLLRDLEIERGTDFADDDEAVLALCDAADARGTGAGSNKPAQVWLTPEGKGFANGEGLPADELETLLCDAECMGAVDDPNARKEKPMSDRQRKRILARDRGCLVPGCRSRWHLDVHHIVHRADGGDNSDENLGTLCRGHHRAHHRGNLIIEGRAPDLTLRFVVGPARTSECPRGH